MITALAERVAAAVAEPAAPLDEAALTAYLTQRFEGTRIVVCSDDDIPARLPAALGNARCRIYYLDATEHCVKLTRDADGARGIVVGLCSDDD